MVLRVAGHLPPLSDRTVHLLSGTLNQAFARIKFTGRLAKRPVELGYDAEDA